MSGVELSLKYVLKYVLILSARCVVNSASFSREELSLQVFVFGVESGKVRVTEIGWWSERYMGSIVACVR